VIKKFYKEFNPIMFMDKRVGYVVAVVGLALMVFNSGNFGFAEGFFEGSGLNPWYVTILSIGLIVVGVAISLMDKGGGGKIKHAKEEVPIYEGVGKNRKIVGYRKD
jgi:hypothetical protein